MMRTLVFDMEHPLARENRCFAPGPTDDYLTVITHALQRQAAAQDITPVTADLFLRDPPARGAAFAVSHMVTAQTPQLLALGVDAAVCFSVESPLTAKRFYHDLRRQVAPFRHAFLFPGAASRLAGLPTVVHPLRIAMDTRDRLPLVPWQERSFLTLINSNKRAGSIAPGLPWALRWQAEATYWALRAVDPLLRGRELYADRLAAIRYFARYDGFHLYGYGWDQPVHRASRATQIAVRQANRGEIAPGLRAKRAVLSRYRFAICFENTVFPGYLTEKLFDCLLAGCIPVYWGDPAVAEKVPSDCYIDCRQFSDLAELDLYLQQMKPAEAQAYLDAAADFLASAAYTPFLADTFAAELLDAAGSG
ncbi:MAG: hypothetical protein IAE81_22165 [Caldilineaceae bacterium]|nr:hypothetical protein [Caldilineaceae bacterium]